MLDGLDVDVAMINNDGSVAANCGNACRCIVASVCRRHGLTTVGSLVRVHTYARSMPCRLIAASPPVVEVDMGLLTDGAENSWHASVLRRALALCSEHCLAPIKRITTSSMGNNHVVLEVEVLSDNDFCILGRGLQSGTELDGINVHVVCPETPEAAEEAAMALATGQQLPLVWRTLIWERGAGRTLACGTGACAVAHHAMAAEASTPAWTAVQMPGGLLYVSSCAATGRLALVGPATHVYDGSLAPSFMKLVGSCMRS